MADKEPKANDVSSSGRAETPHRLVTEYHVRAALTADKGPDARLTGWKIVDFTKKGDNYACAVSSVEIKYVQDGRSSEVVYVVKINAGKRLGNASSMNDMLFETEAKFYLNLAPEINSTLQEAGQREVNFPKCLHISLEKGGQILFLEDLRQRGYKMLDRKRGMDEAHATLVLRELARLHAAFLLLQNKRSDEAIEDKHSYLKQGLYYYIRTFDVMESFIRDSVLFAREIAQKVGGYEKVTAWIDTIIPNLVDIFYEQMKCGEFKVVCHGDCWINNLLFRYSKAGHPEDVMLLDLQLVNHSSPATDLNYLLFTSMTGDVRKPNTKALLGSYYSAFSSIMESAGQKIPFTQAKLCKFYKDNNLLGLLFALMSIPVLLSECDDAMDYSKDTDDDVGETFREERQKAMAVFERSPLLKSRFLSIFDEIMELGIIT